MIIMIVGSVSDPTLYIAVIKHRRPTFQTNQVGGAIGYSVALSCIMANRLCLNVRGMIQRDDYEDLSFPVTPGQYEMSA